MVDTLIGMFVFKSTDISLVPKGNIIRIGIFYDYEIVSGRQLFFNFFLTGLIIYDNICDMSFA